MRHLVCVHPRLVRHTGMRATPQRLAQATLLLALAAEAMAQQVGVEDLFAADWRHRNRAALALCVGDVEAGALLAAVARDAAPWIPAPAPSVVGLGGGYGPDAVETLAARHAQAVVARDHVPPLPEPLRAADDLVVPFDARVLALWVATERGLPGDAIAAAGAPLLAGDREDLQVAAASALWRAGTGAAPAREAALRRPAAAAALATTAADAPAAAAVELLAAVRRGDDAVQRAIFARLPIDLAKDHAPLRTVLVEGLFAAADAAAAIAGARLLAVGEAAVPALAAALAEPAKAPRAAGLLLALGDDAAPAAAELAALLQDPAADETARTRAALALGAVGPALERTAPGTAEAAAAALVRTLDDRRTRGAFGTAVVYALRGYPTARGPAAEAALQRLRRTWLPRVLHGELAATHALLGDAAGSALSIDDLIEIAGGRHHGLATRGMIALARRGADADAALRSLVVDGRALAFDDAARRAFAPVLRGWLAAPAPELHRAAVLQLSGLGAEADVAASQIARIAEGSDDELVRVAARAWFVACVPAAERDAALERLCELPATPTVVATVARFATPAARREELLARVLAGAEPWCWSAEGLDAATVRTVARRHLAGSGDAAVRTTALAALARAGAEDADGPALGAALESASDPSLLLALTEGPSLPRAVAELLTERIGPDADPAWVEAAVRCLWRHRPR